MKNILKIGKRLKNKPTKVRKPFSKFRKPGLFVYFCSISMFFRIRIIPKTDPVPGQPYQCGFVFTTLCNYVALFFLFGYIKIPLSLDTTPQKAKKFPKNFFFRNGVTDSHVQGVKEGSTGDRVVTVWFFLLLFTAWSLDTFRHENYK
jgi:hypothetical protein